MDSMDIPPIPSSNLEFFNPDEMGGGDSINGSTDFPSATFGGPELFRDKFSSFPRKISGKIGDICDKNIPLIFCARKLTALFLLPDEKGDLIPDSCVRVSLKVLAMDCLANVITLLPKIFLLTLYSDQVSGIFTKSFFVMFLSVIQKNESLAVRHGINMDGRSKLEMGTKLYKLIMPTT